MRKCRPNQKRIHGKCIKAIPMWEIKSRDEEYGQYFFSKDTMRFFKSKVESDYAFVKGKNAYFITSEYPSHGSRKYSIREVKLGKGRNWDIHTYRDETSNDQYQKYANKSDAVSDLHDIVSGY